MAGDRRIGSKVDELARVWKPDLLHAHSPVLNALAALRVARRQNVPFLYEIRAFWEDAAVGTGTGTEGSLRYRLTRLLERHAVRAADAVAVICGGLKQDLLARGVAEVKIIVSHNGVDMDMLVAPFPPDFRWGMHLGPDGATLIGNRKTVG